MVLTSLLEEIRNTKLISEDGDNISMSLNKGLSPQDINHYENQLNAKLPLEFKELMGYSNGLNFFGLQILPVNEQEFISGQSMISFHNWGNGDFDCIVVDSQQEQQYPAGQVVFWDHKTNLTVPITGSLTLWLQKAYAELQHHGCLRHPIDYRESKADSRLFFWKCFNKKTEPFVTQGLYSSVKEILKADTQKTKSSKKDYKVEREFYKDGRISNESVYVKGKQHGISRSWHQNGRLASEGHFKNGKLHGPNIIWDQNGKLIAEGFFKDGHIWEGEFLFIDEDKKEFVEKYSKGKLISSTPYKK